MLGNVPNIEHSKLKVITREAPTEEHDESFLNFLHAGGLRTDAGVSGGLTGNDEIMTGSGGTGVPGINRDSVSLGYMSTERSTEAFEAFEELMIPEDEMSDYDDALNDGRTVVAYECSEADSDAVGKAMQQAGVKRVRTHKN
jgi:hypothetical protein